MNLIESFDLPQRPFQSDRTIENLNVPQKPFHVPAPEKYQEVVSEMVARQLLDVFKISTLGILVVGAAMIFATIQLRYPTQDAEGLVEKAIVPFLRGAAIFATTVFGPLLAFILGFYFGKGKQS